MVAIFLLIALINIVGVVTCHSVARSRGSRRVEFWTTMGVLFGPLAIPFVLKSTLVRHDERRNAASRGCTS